MKTVDEIYLNIGQGISAAIEDEDWNNAVLNLKSWNSTEGYSVGWSHGHPGDNADSPSPDDVFVMMDNLTDPELMSAGATAIKFYRDNVSSTVITKDKNYIVTVRDWGKLATLYARFADDAGGFDDDWATIASDHYQNYIAQGEGWACNANCVISKISIPQKFS